MPAPSPPSRNNSTLYLPSMSFNLNRRFSERAKLRYEPRIGWILHLSAASCGHTRRTAIKDSLEGIALAALGNARVAQLAPAPIVPGSVSAWIIVAPAGPVAGSWNARITARKIVGSQVVDSPVTRRTIIVVMI